MTSTPYLEDVHILNFETGYVNSYRIDIEYIEGFEMKLTIPMTTPSEMQQATMEVKNLIDDVTSRGGHFNKSSNTLIDTITIPSDIAGGVHEVAGDYLKSQAVSNFIRLNRIPTVWNIIGKGYDKVFHKIIYKVKVEFGDQTSAIYVLGPALFSDHPFILDRSSLKDSQNNPISVSSEFPGSIAFEDTYNINEGFGITQTCAKYSIKSSSGSTWTGEVCWLQSSR
jgi:hypothetical protein